MLKSIIPCIVVAAGLVVPVLSFAQNAKAATRAEVVADLVQLEGVGYVPGNDRNKYPEGIALAEARVAAQRNTISSSYGNPTSGSAAYDTRKQGVQSSSGTGSLPTDQ
jgi:hypothetical protein